MDILRFITAGSVDDGKSTLIGRLLYDSKSIMVDHLESIERQTRNRGDGNLDLAFITDGLRAEREQGITIDVAYKYFATPRRKFIIADAPGHIQYTRNMVTGASNADLAVILVDARHGVVEQTMRHSIIASLLGISDVIVAINKMDLVNYSEEVFNNIVIRYAETARALGIRNVSYIPMSALTGDNIVEPSLRMPWYGGKPLLEVLEHIEVQHDIDATKPRFSVQYVIRPQTDEHHDYRGYAGKILSGTYCKGDKITVMPSGIESVIAGIETGGQIVSEASAPLSVTLQLEHDVDVSRGDMIVRSDAQPLLTQDIDAIACWMDSKPLSAGNKYLLQINSRVVKCSVKEIRYKLNVNSLEKEYSPAKAQLNDLINIIIRTASPIPVDSYKTLRANGGAILIDETSHLTAGACIIQ